MVANRIDVPYGRGLAERAFGRLARQVGGDPRQTQPIRAVTLIEDVPLLLIHGGADGLVPAADARRLVAAAPPGTGSLVIPGAGHGLGHATDPAAWEAAVAQHLRAAFAMARS
jgi:fermentation-respiration switch protein FrsA (DUF1100 family)